MLLGSHSSTVRMHLSALIISNLNHIVVSPLPSNPRLPPPTCSVRALLGYEGLWSYDYGSA